MDEPTKEMAVPTLSGLDWMAMVRTTMNMVPPPKPATRPPNMSKCHESPVNAMPRKPAAVISTPAMDAVAGPR